MASEQTWTDVFQSDVVLSNSVHDTILVKHPEVRDFMQHVGEALSEPDTVRRSIHDERVILYYRYYEEIFNGKYLVVVVKRIDRNFISTIYITDQIKAGDIIWPS